MAAYQPFQKHIHLLEFYGVRHLRDWKMAKFVSRHVLASFNTLSPEGHL